MTNKTPASGCRICRLEYLVPRFPIKKQLSRQHNPLKNSLTFLYGFSNTLRMSIFNCRPARDGLPDEFKPGRIDTFSREQFMSKIGTMAGRIGACTASPSKPRQQYRRRHINDPALHRKVLAYLLRYDSKLTVASPWSADFTEGCVDCGRKTIGGVRRNPCPAISVESRMAWDIVGVQVRLYTLKRNHGAPGRRRRKC